MSLVSELMTFLKTGYESRAAAARELLPGEPPLRSSEVGTRSTPEQALEYQLQMLEPSFLYRYKVLDIRNMDELDPRVKKIHERTSRAAVNGGLLLECGPGATKLRSLWKDFERRLELNRREKLESDMRGALMEGNLPIQWVLDMDSKSVARAIRMPTETLKPLVGQLGTFKDPRAAYQQWDWVASRVIATFPLWQLNMVRIRPDNYDNWGCFGRPYLDATRQVWRQLAMTEKDLVIRRHTRAPQRFSHVLEGANDVEVSAFETKIASKLNMVTTDFVSNRKGGSTALPGDANLDQIADVVHLLDTFFAGATAPKGLFGYPGDMNRDILEDLKRDYYDELDALQDTVSFIYELGFRLDLLLHGINPDAEEFKIQFMERRTDTPTQRADIALKHQALGVPADLNWRTAGLDPAVVRKHIEEGNDRLDPYPNPQRISITPGNGRKGESGTNVSA